IRCRPAGQHEKNLPAALLFDSQSQPGVLLQRRARDQVCLDHPREKPDEGRRQELRGLSSPIQDCAKPALTFNTGSVLECNSGAERTDCSWLFLLFLPSPRLRSTRFRSRCRSPNRSPLQKHSAPASLRRKRKKSLPDWSSATKLGTP